MHEIVKRVRDAIRTKRVLKIQNSIREYLWQLRWKRIKEAATKSVTIISAYWKMRKLRKHYKELRNKIVTFQSVIRAFSAMRGFYK